MYQTLPFVGYLFLFLFFFFFFFFGDTINLKNFDG